MWKNFSANFVIFKFLLQHNFAQSKLMIFAFLFLFINFQKVMAGPSQVSLGSNLAVNCSVLDSRLLSYTYNYDIVPCNISGNSVSVTPLPLIADWLVSYAAATSGAYIYLSPNQSLGSPTSVSFDVSTPESSKMECRQKACSIKFNFDLYLFEISGEIL